MHATGGRRARTEKDPGTANGGPAGAADHGASRTAGRGRAIGPAVTAGVLAATLAGCGSGFNGVYDLPLPGGADIGDHPITVTAEFANVHDLVPQAAVKVNDVAVGRVTKITLPRNGWTANVTMLVNGRVRLPANAYARLAQSSLLGEKYIQLAAPPNGAGQGTLASGATIPRSRTDRDPEIEEVFGALSLLLNGGGIAQLHTINVELNKALAGNEPQIRSMLERVATLTSDLNDHRRDITAALDGMDRLSATLASRQDQIGTVLDDLHPGLRVLEEQRGSLVTMLRSLETLSTVTVDTINRSKEDMLADLRALAPVLDNLAEAGRDLPRSLQVLLTYPFTDEVLHGIKGDYLNVYLSLTAAPGTQIMAPLVPDDPTDPSVRKDAGLRPAPLPLPSVGTVTTTPTPGIGSAGTLPPGSTPPWTTPPGSAQPGGTPPGTIPPGSTPSDPGGTTPSSPDDSSSAAPSASSGGGN